MVRKGTMIMQALYDTVRTLTFTLSKMGAICRFWTEEWHGLTYISKGILRLCVENRWVWGGEKAGRSREIHKEVIYNLDEGCGSLDKLVVVEMRTSVWILWLRWIEWGIMRQEGAKDDSKAFAKQLVESSSLLSKMKKTMAGTSFEGTLDCFWTG